MTLAIFLSIVVTALVSEDGGTAAAAAVVTGSAMHLPLALFSVVAGLWLGDVAIFAVARRFGPGLVDHRWARRVVSRNALARAQEFAGKSLFFSRFIPGTRVPSYIAAGLSRMHFSEFATTTALSAGLWSVGVIALALAAGRGLLPGTPRWLVTMLATGVLVLGIIGWKRWAVRSISRMQIWFAKMARWEFWPSWLFYAPVPLMCAWLGVRYRGLSLPTIANPAQKNGGIVGESKIQILQELKRAAPQHVAEGFLIARGSFPERIQRINELVESGAVKLPFVLKPDTAQRGEGFRKITSMRQAHGYLIEVSAPVVAQEYVEGPHEAGIFYYRFPGEPRGNILAITDKAFPVVRGDGRRTIRELIEADPRARLIADTYLTRFGFLGNRVPEDGETVRLVEAGNHCQGCIFRDGSHLYSEALRAQMEEISQQLDGFFIGRYDVRYASAEDLRAGRFTILELNGSASEATSIYDERNSLWSAYRTLFRQWELVYAIGAANRQMGKSAASLFDVWRDWKQYQRQAALYPMAD